MPGKRAVRPSETLGAGENAANHLVHGDVAIGGLRARNKRKRGPDAVENVDSSQTQPADQKPALPFSAQVASLPSTYQEAFIRYCLTNSSQMSCSSSLSPSPSEGLLGTPPRRTKPSTLFQPLTPVSDVQPTRPKS